MFYQLKPTLFKMKAENVMNEENCSNRGKEDFTLLSSDDDRRIV